MVPFFYTIMHLCVVHHTGNICCKWYIQSTNIFVFKLLKLTIWSIFLLIPPHLIECKTSLWVHRKIIYNLIHSFCVAVFHSVSGALLLL